LGPPRAAAAPGGGTLIPSRSLPAASVVAHPPASQRRAVGLAERERAQPEGAREAGEVRSAPKRRTDSEGAPAPKRQHAGSRRGAALAAVAAGIATASAPAAAVRKPAVNKPATAINNVLPVAAATARQPGDALGGGPVNADRPAVPAPVHAHAPSRADMRPAARGRGAPAGGGVAQQAQRRSGQPREELIPVKRRLAMSQVDSGGSGGRGGRS
jgi:hypothetical protein